MRDPVVELSHRSSPLPRSARHPVPPLRHQDHITLQGGERGRQHHAERFADQRHGARRSHDGTSARGDGKPALDLGNLVAVDFTGAIPAPEAPAIGARAEALALMAAGHHRAGDDEGGWLAGGKRTHQERRHGLVAAAHQHHGIHRLGADHLLHGHGHQVSVDERSRR